MKKEKKIKIYIAIHKKCKLPNNDIYYPLQMGAGIKGRKDLCFEKDSTGDNISIKNPNYCELTGLYWMWKNSKCDIIGLVHYRRYFFDKIYYHKYENILKKDKINDYLKDYDFIVSKKVRIPFYTVEKQYDVMHHIEDYEMCRNILNEKYPDYVQSFDKISKRRYLYAFNMFISNKSLFDNYCKWLFDVLFELEKRVDISNYSDYDKRIFGFLSERLFNVWLDKNNYKLKELYVYNIEENWLKQLIINIIKKIFIRG